MYDVEKVRGDFPILSREINGRRLVYLDNAATSQSPRSVIQAVSGYYEHMKANVHRGVHTLSMEASDAYEEARGKVQRWLPDIVHCHGLLQAVFFDFHLLAAESMYVGFRDCRVFIDGGSKRSL